MAKEEKNVYTYQTEGNLGSVKITEEVIAIIAGLGAMEVEGVSSMAGSSSRQIFAKLGYKTLSKGVHIEIENDEVKVVLSINLKYGYNLKEISSKIQEKVKTTLENMTGLIVSEVDIRIAGVDMEEA
ncbi:MAG: Asp23/Gls24 family envelope stress response protein [Lachnospiraceae bacterium]|jgi:uncharacterized alkaline shock family protein YloU|nr:Asp23/Gls24 family envelope stress response protein [Lachnospiraceae bacterium]